MLYEDSAVLVVSFLDLGVSGEKPESLVLCWVAVGELKMRHVVHVVVVSPCARLHYPKNAGIAIVVLVLENGSDTQVFGVPIHDFDVRRRPRKAGSFAEPGYTSPEINSLLDSSLLAFVARDL